MIRIILLSIPLIFGDMPGIAQSNSPVDHVAAVVHLDSVVIRAKKAGFEVSDFIRLVQEDQSFYSAFKNLRLASYTWTCEMQFLDRRERIDATYQSTNIQRLNGKCRTMEVLSEKWTGKFFKRRKKKSRYFTYKMYDRLFLTHGVKCENGETNDASNARTSIKEKYVDELKTLIFSPGSHSEIPFIGRKTALFSDKMMPYYDFFISSDIRSDSTECYIFEARLKPEFEDHKENKTVIKSIVSAFDKSNFQIVDRTYRLANSTPVYQFDVTMDVKITRNGGKYYPRRVLYDGTWNILTKRRETGSFELDFTFPPAR